MMEIITKNKLIVFLLICAFIFIAKDKMGNLVINKAFFFGALIIVGILMWDALDRAWKYDSPQIVTANLHCSTDKELTPCGIYVLATMGSILTDEFHMKGSEGTLILRQDQIYEGKNVIIAPVIVEQYEDIYLPDKVYDLVRDSREFKPPYYFGDEIITEYTEILTESGESIEILKNKVKTLQGQVNWHRDRLSEQTRELDNVISHMRRITDKKSIWKTLFSKGEDNE
ncbi:MAG: hypothetical protein HXS54_01350 [Theionarchaea archaeon]|nr:hypothetical protein [Theionarchaea archaeon]